MDIRRSDEESNPLPDLNFARREVSSRSQTSPPCRLGVSNPQGALNRPSPQRDLRRNASSPVLVTCSGNSTLGGIDGNDHTAGARQKSDNKLAKEPHPGSLPSVACFPPRSFNHCGAITPTYIARSPVGKNTTMDHALVGLELQSESSRGQTSPIHSPCSEAPPTLLHRSSLDSLFNSTEELNCGDSLLGTVCFATRQRIVNHVPRFISAHSIKPLAPLSFSLSEKESDPSSSVHHLDTDVQSGLHHFPSTAHSQPPSPRPLDLYTQHARLGTSDNLHGLQDDHRREISAIASAPRTALAVQQIQQRASHRAAAESALQKSMLQNTMTYSATSKRPVLYPLSVATGTGKYGTGTSKLVKKAQGRRLADVSVAGAISMVQTPMPCTPTNMKLAKVKPESEQVPTGMPSLVAPPNSRLRSAASSDALPFQARNTPSFNRLHRYHTSEGVVNKVGIKSTPVTAPKEHTNSEIGSPGSGSMADCSDYSPLPVNCSSPVYVSTRYRMSSEAVLSTASSPERAAPLAESLISRGNGVSRWQLRTDYQNNQGHPEEWQNRASPWREVQLPLENGALCVGKASTGRVPSAPPTTLPSSAAVDRDISSVSHLVPDRGPRDHRRQGSETSAALATKTDSRTRYFSLLKGRASSSSLTDLNKRSTREGPGGSVALKGSTASQVSTQSPLRSSATATRPGPIVKIPSLESLAYRFKGRDREVNGTCERRPGRAVESSRTTPSQMSAVTSSSPCPGTPRQTGPAILASISEPILSSILFPDLAEQPPVYLPKVLCKEPGSHLQSNSSFHSLEDQLEENLSAPFIATSVPKTVLAVRPETPVTGAHPGSASCSSANGKKVIDRSGSPSKSKWWKKRSSKRASNPVKIPPPTLDLAQGAQEGRGSFCTRAAALTPTGYRQHFRLRSASNQRLQGGNPDLGSC